MFNNNKINKAITDVAVYLEATKHRDHELMAINTI